MDPPAAPPTERRWRAGWFSRFWAFTPIWFWLVAQLASPRFSEPMFANPPGISIGWIVAGFVVVWMLLGVYLVWKARSLRVVLIAYLLFTVPATFALILGPALVLIIQNL